MNDARLRTQYETQLLRCESVCAPVLCEVGSASWRAAACVLGGGYSCCCRPLEVQYGQPLFVRCTHQGHPGLKPRRPHLPHDVCRGSTGGGGDAWRQGTASTPAARSNARQPTYRLVFVYRHHEHLTLQSSQVQVAHLGSMQLASGAQHEWAAATPMRSHTCCDSSTGTKGSRRSITRRPRSPPAHAAAMPPRATSSSGRGRWQHSQQRGSGTAGAPPHTQVTLGHLGWARRAG